MSPSNYHQDSEMTPKPVMTINGSRPSPLRINRDSHAIHKPQYPTAAIENNSGKKRQPVIIYTHSPKIIHTQARDFMSLVQKLTGLSRSSDDAKSSNVKSEPPSDQSDRKDRSENNDSSSVLTEEKFYEEVNNNMQESSAISSMYKTTSSSNPYLMDAPLFTPNSDQFFCSSRPNALFQSPSSISPAFMDYMKGFPEY